jgi:ubiquinol oxidase
MCCDYGLRTGVQRLYGAEARIPIAPYKLALANFAQEYKALRRSFREDVWGAVATAAPPRGPIGRLLYAAGGAVVRVFSAIDQRLEASGVLDRLLPREIPKEVFDPRTGGLSRECRELRAKLALLTLSNDRVWARERKREASGGGVETPFVVKAAYLVLCLFLDFAYANRPIARFWFLETVARMPYFSYITCLHLLESFGWWRAGAELRRVHAAEEYNELHHLQVMEALGGDQLWVDRFMAQHAAILYYWVLVALFLASPPLAYQFSELIESHAVDTYGEFVDANEELLRALPPPAVAVQYWSGGGEDAYKFDGLYQTAPRDSPRRVKIRSLYDVFAAIRDDEAEHVATMSSCQDLTVAADLEALRAREAAAAAAGGAASAPPPGRQQQFKAVQTPAANQVSASASSSSSSNSNSNSE